MRRTLITLALVAAMAGTAMADKTQSYCASEWPGDFRMQKHCVDRQREGAVKAGAFFNKYGLDKLGKGADISNNPHAQIWAKCERDWRLPRFDTWDWRMVAHCLGRQIEAYDSLR